MYRSASVTTLAVNRDDTRAVGRTAARGARCTARKRQCQCRSPVQRTTPRSGLKSPRRDDRAGAAEQHARARYSVTSEVSRFNSPAASHPSDRPGGTAVPRSKTNVKISGHLSAQRTKSREWSSVHWFTAPLKRAAARQSLRRQGSSENSEPASFHMDVRVLAHVMFGETWLTRQEGHSRSRHLPPMEPIVFVR